MSRALAAPLLLAFLTQVTPARASCMAPTQATITIDGDMSDWLLVRANPLNVSTDGDGSSLACSDSSDRDCPVPTNSADLASFAFTWDATALYALVEYHGAWKRNPFAWIYVDRDNDGLMETTDLLVQGDIDLPVAKLFDYRNDLPGGDPILDALGRGDGYTIAGAENGLDLGATPTIARSLSEFAIELAIPWVDLGVPPGSPLGLHVAHSDGARIPNDVTDNMGGAGGLASGTAFRCLTLSPGDEVGTAAGTTARLPHAARNAGNVPFIVELAVSATCPDPIDVWLDVDADGTGDVRLAHDANADGVLSGPGDILYAAGDSDGNGRLDLGSVGMLETLAFVVDQAFAFSTACQRSTISVRVEAAGDAAIAASATDVVHLGDVTLVPERSIVAAAGEPAWLAHAVGNGTSGAMRLDLAGISALGWPASTWTDPDGDGDPSDAAPMTDTDSSTVPDATLAPGAAAGFFVRVDVPAGAAVGSSDDIFVIASRGGATDAFVLDSIAVRNPVDLSPNHLVDTDDELHGGSGESVYFAHRLVNASGSPRVFDVTAVSDAGWGIVLLTDPDGNGRPNDSSPWSGTTPPVRANGGTLDMIVRVDIPPAVLPPARSRVTITARRSDAPALLDNAWDDAVAAIVRVYEDAAHVVSVSDLPPCATAHAFASGLPGSTGGYRFTWRDEAGLAIRVQAVSTDAAGACGDLRILAPGESGTGLSVTIESFDGSAWQVLDSAVFDVTDSARVDSLLPSAATHDMTSPFAASVTLVNDSFGMNLEGLSLRVVALSPDGTSYLDPSGAFLPYTGTEATTLFGSLALPRLSSRTLDVRVDPCAFAVDGTHRLEAWLSPSCGPERLAASATFGVSDDADRDGLDRATELANGTDPLDADSDDDGVPDGEDGVIDSDADGLIDALDCDSDNDTLPDGLETGVVLPGPGTDVAAGCFIADQDPTKTTDPRAMDTDGGGLPDGAEDRDRDGALDPSETDPLDGADDTGSCSALPPPEVTGLRVAREGASARLSWTPIADPCTGYVVLAATSLPGLGVASELLWTATHSDATPVGPSGVVFYRVRGESVMAGSGPP